MSAAKDQQRLTTSEGNDRTVIRHSEDRDLSNGSVASFHSTSALVNGGQISVHVTWISSAAWNFFSRCRNLSESIAVCCQIGKDDQNMLFQLISVILGCRESKSRCDDTLDARLF